MDPRWLTLALGELHVAEVPGPGDNPRIVAYHAKTTFAATDDEVPWCSSFVNWVMVSAGYTPTGSAAARSWLHWGTTLAQPRLGAVTVLTRGSPTTGHVGLWIAGDEEWGWLLGGNQQDRVSIARFPRSRVLGWRWPLLTVPV